VRIQLRRAHQNDEGAIAVIVALLAVIIVVMAAFAVDLGNAYAVKRQLSVAADAAALDAARAVASTRVSGQPILGGNKGCLTWSAAERSAAESAAESTANSTNAANDLSGNSTVDDVDVYCRPDGTGVEVTVDNSRDLPVFFGGVADATGYTPARSATAAVVPRLAVGGLRPYAACNTVVLAAKAAPGETFVMDLDNKIGVCNTSKPGNWGVVDFDGGSNPLADISNWTTNGYPNPVTAPSSNLPGDPGMPGPGKIDGPLSGLIGKVVLFPVVTDYTAPSKPGDNARFNLVGFVGAQVCGYRLNNKVETGACFDSTKAAPYDTAKVNYIQFRYVDYVSSYGGGGAVCSFSDPKCEYAILSSQLYK
jgi:Flp pilus assembly protein TadG